MGGWGKMLGGHGVGSFDAEDETFKEGVAGEAVGSVDAGAGGFSGGVEAGDGGAAMEVGFDAAHEVVGRGADGDEVATKFELVAVEEGGDAGEAGDEVFAAGTHVEEDRAFEALAGDGAGDDVAGCELGEGMDGEHEALAAGVEEEGAFTAERLAEEEAGCAFAGVGGGMELVELHVLERGAGTISHGDAVPGSDGGVGGIAEDLAGTSAGEEHGSGEDGGEGAVFA